MDPLRRFIGESPEVSSLRDSVRRLLDRWSPARRPPPVLIQGETGTGKGLLARLIHEASPRADRPFVDLNCAAFPESLIEAELFGYERGAFTDARQGKPGLFHLADGGTLFLDEVGLLSPSAQAKFLTAIEEGTIRRLGGTRAQPVDVWVLAATNASLDEATFRRDLFHRLAVLTLVLPPLRSRPADIMPLAEHLLARACADYGLPPRVFAADARAALTVYPWPGNGRELGNVIERTVLFVEAPVLTAGHLRFSTGEAGSGSPARPEPTEGIDAAAPADELERALAETDWNISRTAKMLGIARNTVRARIARRGLHLERTGETSRPSRTVAPVARPVTRVDVQRVPAWDLQRLTFVRVQAVTDPGSEPDVRLAGHFDALGKKLVEFGGRIEGMSPVALLAVFGLDTEDEPTVHAAHGALAIQNAARQIRSNGGELRLMVGMHVEEIRRREGGGLLDADASRRVWATLDTVFEPAIPDAIVATTKAAALLRRRFVLSRLDPTAATYRVEAPWHAHATATSPPTPMVGRREELNLLTSRVAALGDGRGDIVEIVGEPGIGKSRLLTELLGSLAPSTVRCLEGRCSPAETRTPFFPLLQLVRAVCGIEESDQPSKIPDAVHRALADMGLAPDTVGEELCFLLGADMAAPETPGAALTRRLYEALQTLFVTLSRQRPLVIIVEDLHWIDSASSAWLATLVDSLAAAAILLVVTYRSEYRSPWADRADRARLPLAPLPTAESLTLIRNVLASASSSERLEQSIQTKAEGNPLFLEELSLAALERGDGTMPDGIPATVEDAVSSRLARLEARQRRLLRAAALIGREFPVPLLRAVCDVAEADLDAILRQFQQGGFLAVSREREPRGVFKHALVQEAAYKGMSPHIRQALHLRVVEAIEKLYPERLMDFVERLADHAEQGGDSVQAIRYLVLAGGKAAGRSALAEAASHLDHGLRLLFEVPPSPDRDRQELKLQVAFGNALRASKGDAAPETARAYARARELLRLVEDATQVGAALAGDWSSHVLRAKYEAAQLVAEELLSAAERHTDPLIRVIAHRSLGMTALYRGDFRTVRRELEQGLAAYRPSLHGRAIAEYGVDPYVACLAYLGRALWCLGYPEQALARNRQALAEAEAGGAAFGIAIARGMLTTVHQLRREIAATAEASRRSAQFAAEWGITYWQAHAAALRSWADAHDGVMPDPRERLASVREGLDQYLATKTRLGLTWFLGLLAETCLALSLPHEGLAIIKEALALVQETGERFHEAEIHRLEGDLLVLAGGPGAEASAEDCFLRALGIARDRDAKAWELRAATSLARLLHDGGRHADAEKVLRPVYEWFTEGFDTADLVDARALLDVVCR